MTSACSIAAKHYQVGSDVIARMLDDVVQGEAPLGGQAERALAPDEMELPKELRVSNAGFLLEVAQIPQAIRVFGQGPKPRVE
jgi:hypothetical protein